MPKDFLSSVANDANSDEGVSELVVTALGTSGTHYICWKTKTGEYRQKAHGLPTQLEQWLFPSNGTTRDFATLQVILLGNEAFWASDKDGEIRNDDYGALKQLRRAITFNEDGLLSTRQQCLSRGRGFEQKSERLRSSTLPATLSRENNATRKQLKPLLSRTRSLSLEKVRLGPAVPVGTQHQRRIFPLRPRSIDTSTMRGELGALKEQPSPQLSAKLPSTFDLQHNFTKEYSYGQHETRVTGNIRPTSIVQYNPSYTDAGVQTDPEPEPSLVLEYESLERRSQRNSYEAQCDSDTSFSLSLESCDESRRSSFHIPTTRPNSRVFEPRWGCPPTNIVNPIMMGRMQDYFRSASYVLGAALHPQGLG
ncbi:hypothetical protein HD806DRAFT_552231 [Xylariaceae sp. AK1471]|nr:hypothetical protein HD806DRAFT_552231 [Xylariaceae sp. AK1471]